MQLTNDFNAPAPIVAAVANDTYSAGDADISVTQLLDPPRKVTLELRHKDELSEDVSDKLRAILGQAVHVILERSGVGVQEERLYTECLGWRVSGQFDYIDEDGILWDWKTASVDELKYGVKESREQQLNLYALLAREAGYEVNGLRVGFFLIDWKKTRRYQSNYPPTPILQYPVRLWPDARPFLEERVRLHQQARVELPECTWKERWGQPDKYAVYRGTSDRVYRLLGTQQEAVDYIMKKGWNDAYVKLRAGESARCKDYCAASTVCTQWAELQGRVHGQR